MRLKALKPAKDARKAAGQRHQEGEGSGQDESPPSRIDPCVRSRARRRRRGAYVLAAFLLAECGAVVAQVKLPEPTRTVYRCEAGGKVAYSDAPCLGARRVDAEATRGLDALSGRKLTGADVQRERQREMLAEALRPLTGKSAGALDVDRRRLALAPRSKVECAGIDRELPRLEAAERAAAGAARADVQADLLRLRMRYRALGC